MNDEGNDKLKATLEPSQAEVDRVVVAALRPQQYGIRRHSPWLALAAAAVLIAVVVTMARRQLSLTGPLPVAPELTATSKVSNLGIVMLLEGPAGRTLLLSRTATAPTAPPQVSYRLMIAKGAAR